MSADGTFHNHEDGVKKQKDPSGATDSHDKEVVVGVLTDKRG